jgi:hypothetical protein
MTPDEPDNHFQTNAPSVDLFATDVSAGEPAARVLGNYRLLGQLGRGGMGVVYEAEPIHGGPRVALKTLQSGTSASLARFKAEFRIVTDLAHPNLVKLGELDTTAREPFFTMEILRGTSFDEFVRSSFESMAATSSLPFNEERLRESLRQLADGLASLHACGLIHRDIKPSNVMVSPEGRVVILDMGLAVETDEASYRNSQHELAGTPYFMAPEQARGEAITAACDWYAVGVMLFEALTGEKAFQSRRHEALLAEKMTGKRIAPREIVNAVPVDLNDLCCDLLRPSPQDRPASAEVLRRLQATKAATRDSSAWVGRSQELQKLKDAWAQVHEGVAQVVFVTGVSGMGKTSLVDHFLTRLRRDEAAVVLRGRCYENEAVAYRGFDSVVDSLANYLRRLPKAEVERVLPLDLDELCQLFPVLSEVPTVANQRRRLSAKRGDPRERRQKGMEALRELLCRLSRFTSLIIFIDDLQQGDDDTAAIFRVLMHREEAPRALFLATYRSEDAETNACLRQIRRCQLQPAEQLPLLDQVEIFIDRLSHDDSIRVASSLLLRHSITNAEDVERIAGEADGDPLFIRMLAEHRIRFHESAEQQPKGETRQWTLTSVIEETVRSLDSHERIALEVLAAAGRPVSALDLESVVAQVEGPMLGLIRSLRVKRLIRRLGDLERIESFHDKIRETVLTLISSTRLSRHCLALAEQIDRQTSDRDVEFLADLYRRGGDRSRAGECYEAAAAIAESTFAFSRAVEYYRYAISLQEPTGAQEAKLRKGLGDALANSSQSAQAAQQYLKAAAVADDEERANLQQLAALRYLTSGHVEEGIDALREVLAHYKLPWPGNRLLAVVGLLTRAGYLRIRGLRPREGVRSDAKDKAKLDACWSAAAGLSLVDPLRGSYYIAETLCRSLRIGSSETIPRDLAAYMGQVAIGGSRSRASTRRVLLASRGIASKQRAPYVKAMQFLTRGIAALLRGQWSASLGCCDTATRYLADPTCYGKTWELNTARTFALWALQYQGNLVELSQRQPELLRVAKESDDLFATLNFGTQVMAHLQLASDRPEESLRRLTEDKTRLSDRGFFIQHHNYVLAKTYTLLYQGDVEQALSTIDGQWRNYRQEFLSQIQQVRIDHRQVLIRALITAAESGYDSVANIARAKHLVRSLRNERVAWGTALAETFHASYTYIEGRKEEAIEQLSIACGLLDRADMRLFATAARHQLARFESGEEQLVQERWKSLGVGKGERMAQMLVPGFMERVEKESNGR